MKNILIYSDLHINLSSLKECILILEEIGMLVNKYNIDTLINLGDTFDGLKPSSQELDIFATFIRRLGPNKQHIILAADSHESETKEISVLNHYGILADNVRIVKEYKDQNHLYCGHFVLTESNKNYGAKISKESLKDFAYVFLGHQHSYEIIKPNICHSGSTRWVSFDETKDNHKIVTLISDYGGEKEEIHFLGLKSPIKMVEIILNSNNNNNLQEKDLKNTLKIDLQASNSCKNENVDKDTLASESKVSEGETPINLRQIDLVCQKLDKLDPKTKVKVKIMDFQSFREFLPFVNKYSSKFEIFKYTTEFEVITEKVQNDTNKEMTTFKENFTSWLHQQNVDQKIKDILLKEIE
jgi:DNA repair exonuclease SbcCD nuclease subunit